MEELQPVTARDRRKLTAQHPVEEDPFLGFAAAVGDVEGRARTERDEVDPARLKVVDLPGQQGDRNGERKDRPYGNRPNGDRNNGQGYQKGNSDNRNNGFRKDNAGGGFNNDRGGNRNQGERNNFRKAQPSKDFIEAPIKDVEKHRKEEERLKNQDRDKRSKKDLIYEDDGAVLPTKNKAGKFIKPEKKVEVVDEQIKVLVLPDKLTIKELADKMKMQPSAIVKKLFLQVYMWHLTEKI